MYDDIDVENIETKQEKVLEKINEIFYTHGRNNGSFGFQM